MEVVEKYKWLVVAGVAVILLGGLLVINGNETVDVDPKETVMTEKEKKAEAEKKKAEEAEKMMEKAAEGERTYTAHAGDSYTVFARAAVQAYAEESGVNVSRAQIVAAETFLTQDAGAPVLEIGQEVTLDKSAVSKAVEKAGALTSSELAAWQVYVPYVNFDTSHVH